MSKSQHRLPRLTPPSRLPCPQALGHCAAQLNPIALVFVTISAIRNSRSASYVTDGACHSQLRPERSISLASDSSCVPPVECPQRSDAIDLVYGHLHFQYAPARCCMGATDSAPGAGIPQRSTCTSRTSASSSSPLLSPPFSHTHPYSHDARVSQ